VYGTGSECLKNVEIFKISMTLSIKDNLISYLANLNRKAGRLEV